MKFLTFVDDGNKLWGKNSKPSKSYQVLSGGKVYNVGYLYTVYFVSNFTKTLTSF